MSNQFNTLEQIQTYYGSILQGSKDLQTSACCTDDSTPSYIKKVLAKIDDEILSRFYGCGSPMPLALEGKTILDLGCGTGRDVYVASSLVGQNGYVIGVDMTDEQLEVANRHIDSQTKRFGYIKPNVDFRKGYIENLKDIGIEDNSIDIVISNCVLNLSPNKEKVFSEIFRVLKPGGELFFSDIFTGRRISEELKSDPVLHGECLAGALYIEDFRRLLRKLDCLDYRSLDSRRIDLDNPEIEAKIGMIDFYSITIRAFKLDNLEDLCEDYGQLAVYKGTIKENPHSFTLDDHHIFHTGKASLVCGNTASMLEETRFKKHFQIIGNKDVHYGPFDCGTTPILGGSIDVPPPASCC